MLAEDHLCARARNQHDLRVPSTFREGTLSPKLFSMMRGKLIILEGLDRAGKSSQCFRLSERLQKEGHKVRHMRFPGDLFNSEP